MIEVYLLCSGYSLPTRKPRSDPGEGFRRGDEIRYSADRIWDSRLKQHPRPGEISMAVCACIYPFLCKDI